MNENKKPKQKDDELIPIEHGDGTYDYDPSGNLVSKSEDSEAPADDYGNDFNEGLDTESGQIGDDNG